MHIHYGTGGEALPVVLAPPHDRLLPAMYSAEAAGNPVIRSEITSYMELDLGRVE